ncbi:MAG: Hpt domain-containing protein [Pirellulaceae bacterium]
MVDVNRLGQSVTAPLDVDALVERCMGSLSFAEKILSRFESRCFDDLQALEQCQAQHDLAEIGNLAHRLKGSAACVSAPGIADTSEELEDLVQAERYEEIPACLERLRQEWQRFSQFSASLSRPFADG